MNKRTLVILFIALAAGCCIAISQDRAPGFHVVDSISLGGETGWDYCLVDTMTGRFYTSRGTKVQVVDVKKKQIIGEIVNTNGVHGIALVHAANKGYTSNGRDSSLTVFNLETLQPIKTIKIKARNPDAILYEPITKRIFTFNGGSACATAIDINTDQEIGTVAVGGKPEFAVTDGKTIYVNIEDKSLIVAFDAATLKIIKQWSIAPGEEPSGLAIDRRHHRLFSVCGNKLMVISNTETGTVVATAPIDDGTDGVSFDPALQLAFSANGSGTMTVVREESPDKYSVAETVPTRRGARTNALDAATHRIYTVSAKYGPAPAPTAERPRPRAPIEPGSVAVYILSR